MFFATWILLIQLASHSLSSLESLDDFFQLVTINLLHQSTSCHINGSYKLDVKSLLVLMAYILYTRPGLWKQGMKAHKIWQLFQDFMAHNFLWWYTMAMKFSRHIKHNTNICFTRYDPLCNRVQFVPTCPVFAGLVTLWLTYVAIAIGFN